jgi:PAS domain-containing protein
VSTVQKPLELILARNLMTSLSTPAFLTDERGVLIFYNEAAGQLLGKRFEELGALGEKVWETVGPFDHAGERVPIDDLPLTLALRDGCPAHAAVRIRSFAGAEHDIEVSALPIVTAQGSRGAMAFFWPERDHPDADADPGADENTP